MCLPLNTMGNQFNNAELRKIHAETQNKPDFGNAPVNHEFTWNVLDLQTLESNPFRQVSIDFRIEYYIKKQFLELIVHFVHT